MGMGMAGGFEEQEILCESLLVHYLDTEYITAKNSILFVPYVR